MGVEKMERYLGHQFDSLDVEHKQLVFLKFQEIYLFLIDKPGDEISNKPEQLWSNGDSIAFKKFDKFLNKYGARICYNGEGSYYIGGKADYLYNLFKGRISESVTYYLKEKGVCYDQTPKVLFEFNNKNKVFKINSNFL